MPEPVSPIRRNSLSTALPPLAPVVIDFSLKAQERRVNNKNNNNCDQLGTVVAGCPIADELLCFIFAFNVNAFTTGKGKRGEKEAGHTKKEWVGGREVESE